MGYMGFYEYTRFTSEEVTTLDLIYRTIQLIGIRSGDVEGRLPWQLELSRFLVPMVAGYTAFQAFIVLFWEQWQQVKVRFLRRHGLYAVIVSLLPINCQTRLHIVFYS